uniref:Uncharacterized protein n=1 Tax=Ditylenchus dipsaci TaxID=166011 RepID=A0A915D321_9BILA
MANKSASASSAMISGQCQRISTGNMINHLKKKGHAEELKKYQDGECMNRLSGRMAEMFILIKANLKKLRLAPSTELDDEEVGKEKGTESEKSGEE